ncbi:Fe-S cluster assembly scaffold SufA [Candidatus Erwinia haradaeae]|uniref:Protein SufA n=1 Tax=Candidatus Erwinia haradaeae TaxID=1922217 RepID=A0A451DAP8_9GAMM|nr:Fe-S cluster assembly scaffold SufA [Candidatus Erwinia haradaeae]VFP83295.1 Protein SufA [Candidatus Erwinia haradaeae]
MPLEKSTTLPSDGAIWKGVTLTNRAAEYIQHLAARDPNIKGLQIDVKPSGCAGLSYSMNLVTTKSQDDLSFSHHGACVFVPLHAMPYIDGTEVDYVYVGLNQIFKFNNPRAQHACGCGESFGVE